MTDDALRRLIEEAAERGAERALLRVGLHDEGAGDDIRDLRKLLTDWRAVRKTVLVTITRTVTLFVLGLLAAGAAVTLWRGGK